MINTNILKKIIVTEKALRTSAVHEALLNDQVGQVVTFCVDQKATKPQIKALIEAVYEVKVKSINTLNQKGKVKYFKQKVGRRSDFKKAYVTLEPGYKIDIPVFNQIMDNVEDNVEKEEENA